MLKFFVHFALAVSHPHIHTEYRCIRFEYNIYMVGVRLQLTLFKPKKSGEQLSTLAMDSRRSACIY